MGTIRKFGIGMCVLTALAGVSGAAQSGTVRLSSLCPSQVQDFQRDFGGFKTNANKTNAQGRSARGAASKALCQFYPLLFNDANSRSQNVCTSGYRGKVIGNYEAFARALDASWSAADDAVSELNDACAQLTNIYTCALASGKIDKVDANRKKAAAEQACNKIKVHWNGIKTALGNYATTQISSNTNAEYGHPLFCADDGYNPDERTPLVWLSTRNPARSATQAMDNTVGYLAGIQKCGRKEGYSERSYDSGTIEQYFAVKGTGSGNVAPSQPMPRSQPSQGGGWQSITQ